MSYFEKPGTSGFDSGAGIRIVRNDAIESALQNSGWQVLRRVGGETELVYGVVGKVKEVRYTAVSLFQRHWTRERPLFTLPETGIVDSSTLQALSLYSSNGYTHSCPSNSLPQTLSQNNTFMLVILVPLFSIASLYSFSFLFVTFHSSKKENMPLLSNQKWHQDPHSSQSKKGDSSIPLSPLEEQFKVSKETLDSLYSPKPSPQLPPKKEEGEEEIMDTTEERRGKEEKRGKEKKKREERGRGGKREELEGGLEEGEVLEEEGEFEEEGEYEEFEEENEIETGEEGEFEDEDEYEWVSVDEDEEEDNLYEYESQN